MESEDPTTFVSEKTGRGPLEGDWIAKGWDKKEIMCAYKLCRVEFRVWGAQGRIEKFIHDVALRKVMLRAHRQAWAWQDEWYGLTMEDVRKIEKETQELLAQKMASKTDETADESKLQPTVADGTPHSDHSSPQKERLSDKSDISSDEEFVDAETS